MSTPPNNNAFAEAATTEQTKRALYLSHFTPSMMPPETLEAMLVQRGPLLARVLDHVTESLRNGSRHHTLLVGPRGIGKTHLISLLHHRLVQTAEAQDKALVAWMREEEWGVTSFFELILRILRNLDAAYPHLGISVRTEPLYELTPAQAAPQAEAILLDVLAGKTLVVLMENLDDLFEQIGDAGQKAWRAFLQNHANMVLVCTTPALFAGVNLHKSPFYGLFDIEMLAELDFDDVVDLLRKVAQQRGDTQLAAFIDTPDGKARIRAVHHLAEGNPRIYIIFAQFLSQQALDDLVQAFMHTLDELTPYYQARMKELPGQQRKIAEYLLHYRGAAPVKLIAKSCFITQQVCSSQLKQLKDKRFVRSIQAGRESHYELAEPLMRLCMEVKKQRGEPVSLFVDMLRIWYREEELQGLLRDGLPEGFLPLAYVEKAIEKMRAGDDPKVSAWLRDFKKFTGAGNLNAAWGLFEEFKILRLADPYLWGTFAMLVGVRALQLGLKSITPQPPQVCTKLTEGFLKSLTSEEGIEVSFKHVVTNMVVSFALFVMDPVIAKACFPLVQQQMEKYPAFAATALMKQIGLFDISDGTLMQWAKQLIDASVGGSKLREFSGTLTAMHDTLQSGNIKDLLKLPAEQRKLIKQHLMPVFELAQSKHANPTPHQR